VQLLLEVVQFGLRARPAEQEIPSPWAQGSSSLRLKKRLRRMTAQIQTANYTTSPFFNRFLSESPAASLEKRFDSNPAVAFGLKTWWLLRP